MKKKSVVRAVIVRCRQPTRRTDGSYVRFDNNAVVMIDNDKNPARHAHFRRGRPRVAGPEFHENRQPRQRGGVMHIRVDDIVEVITGEDRVRPGQSAQGAPLRRTSWSWKASIASTSTCAAASGTRRAAGSRKRCRSSMSNVLLVCPRLRQGHADRRSLSRTTAARTRYCKKCDAEIGVIAPPHSKPQETRKQSSRRMSPALRRSYPDDQTLITDRQFQDRQG